MLAPVEEEVQQPPRWWNFSTASSTLTGQRQWESCRGGEWEEHYEKFTLTSVKLENCLVHTVYFNLLTQSEQRTAIQRWLRQRLPAQLMVWSPETIPSWPPAWCTCRRTRAGTLREDREWGAGQHKSRRPPKVTLSCKKKAYFTLLCFTCVTCVICKLVFICYCLFWPGLLW